MANENPGSPSDSRADETSFSPRPDTPPPGADARWARASGSTWAPAGPTSTGQQPAVRPTGYGSGAPDGGYRTDGRPGGPPGEPVSGQGGPGWGGPSGTGQHRAVNRSSTSTGGFPAVHIGHPPGSSGAGSAARPAYGPPTAQYGQGQPGGTAQFGGPGWGPPPPPAPERRGPGWAALVVVGLVAALLGGLLGVFGPGLVGGGSGSGGSAGVLGDPIPDIDAASAPVGPVEAVAARVLPSVVQLRVEGQGQAGEGSGIVLSADGLILTNNHVVEAAAGNGSVTVVYQDGQTSPAQIVGLDPTSDLAVIRAQGRTDLTPAELGNSDAVRVGQQVVAFGSPLGLGGTVTSGIISAVDRAVSVGAESGASAATVLNALQTDAAINPGNSGGPLTDMEGRIIGINSVIATTGDQGGSIGVGFAIPINPARRIAEELEATGSATRAVLGVSLAPDDERSLAGAVVQSVTPGGAAEQAGIVAGDVIVRFGDQRVANAIELQAAVRSHTPGEPVEVELADRTIQVTPTAESG